jgi:hypothetical protein|nr:hypothetical protein [Neorhizobium tomejilense]
MDTQQRFDRIVDHLAAQFGGGNSSVHKDDILADGVTVLGPEVGEVLTLIRGGGIDIGASHVAVEALDTFSSAWSSGFDLASGDDMVTDNATVSDILCEYHGDRQVPRPEILAAPRR